ncbi:hypothetical protein [Planobispora longispora]|uniref:hypothetical protein n=1 Tax=Planobispora longispora TaxID=28887 RepID=UPI00194396BD|nr:hypothetical protein [Planobispora longispora]
MTVTWEMPDRPAETFLRWLDRWLTGELRAVNVPRPVLVTSEPITPSRGRGRTGPRRRARGGA